MKQIQLHYVMKWHAMMHIGKEDTTNLMKIMKDLKRILNRTFPILAMLNLIAYANGYTQSKHSALDHPHQYETVRKIPNELLHCIPRTESILLHQDALRSYAQDTMLVNRNRKIAEMKDEMYLVKYNYERAVQQENQKYLDQSQLNANLLRDVDLANKQIKKEKSGKNFWKVVAGLFAGAAGVLAISK